MLAHAPTLTTISDTAESRAPLFPWTRRCRPPRRTLPTTCPPGPRLIGSSWCPGGRPAKPPFQPALAAHTACTCAWDAAALRPLRQVRRALGTFLRQWEQHQEGGREENVADAASAISTGVLRWTVSAWCSPKQKSGWQLGTCHADDNGEGDLHPGRPQGSLLAASHAPPTRAPTLTKTYMLMHKLTVLQLQPENLEKQTTSAHKGAA